MKWMRVLAGAGPPAVWLASAACASGSVNDFPNVAVDGAGDARFVWSASFGIGQGGVLERGLVGSQLDDAEFVSAFGSAALPHIAVSPTGVATFTWLTDALKARRRAIDGSLGPIVTVSPATQGSGTGSGDPPVA